MLPYICRYSNNQVRYWNVLEAGEECTLEASSSALMLDESADEETVVNFPNHVAVNKNYTAAGYSQGKSDILSYNPVTYIGHLLKTGTPYSPRLYIH